MADSLRPAVTVVDHPGHEVGRVAAARLLARLASRTCPSSASECRPGSSNADRGSSAHDAERRRRPRHRHHLVQGRGLVGVATPAAPCAEQPTPWHTGDCGRTEIDPYRLVDVAVDLIGRAVRAAESAWGPVGSAPSA
jgi:hypothetical protein